MADNSSDLIGRTIGNWVLIRSLGSGAFGAVYEAHNVAIAGKRAALKILSPQLALRPEIQRRFINEASAASRAEHANIIIVYDGGVTPDGICYIVMELLRGSTLTDAVRQSPLSFRRSLYVCGQVASALEAAHRLGIVHRDLKPDNIFLVDRPGDPDFVKVLDFGVAKLQTQSPGDATRQGVILGTPAYMSPEQWRTETDIDGRADIYSLGIILFRCLTGRLPFQAQNDYEWIRAHIEQTPPDLRSYGVPEPVAALAARMMAKDRADRPASMAEVRDLLQEMAQAPEALTLELSLTEDLAAYAAASRLPREGLQPSTLGSSIGERISIADRAPVKRSRSVGAVVVGAVVVAATVAWVGTHFLSRPTSPQSANAPNLTVRAVQPATLPSAPQSPPAIAEPIPIQVEKRKPTILPESMVLLPGGVLQMGRSSYGHVGALDVPVHAVDVKAFALDRTEVTMGDYEDFVRDRHDRAPWAVEGENEATPLSPDARRMPVVKVGYQEAERYCAFRQEGGRLPTEAEWEWAARGASGRLFPWGNAFRAQCANGKKGSRGTLVPVDGPACGATPEGIFGLSGNAWEWTSSPPSRYAGEGLVPPKGRYHVVRGGSFFQTHSDELTGTWRLFVDRPNEYLGFRCALDVATH